MKVQIFIPTVESRLREASDLALETGGSIIVDPVGDGSEHSATDNHIRAMRCADSDTDWVVILEDDAVPIDDFVGILHRQLSEIEPDRVVSLYLGKQRPPMIQQTIERTIARTEEDTSWLTTRMLWWGVGVCIPVKFSDSVADYVLSSGRPWDAAVGYWALTTKVDVWYTWPSLVDHSDGQTTISHADGFGRESGRVAWKVGTPTPNGKAIMVE